MRNFSDHEFTCKCGCGLNNMQGGVLHKLDDARDIAGIPFIVNSGSRCVAHNKAEGGKSNSAHLKGWAVDIAADNSRARYKIVMALLTVGFRRIGIAKKFIHADMDPTKPQEVVFLY